MVFTLMPPVRHRIIGHRGAPSLAPENTSESFRQAKAQALNWVEFDAQTCATGEWIVIHDDTLDRTTPGKGRVGETPYAMIKALKIPTLAETLTLLLSLNLHPNIEIKGNYRDPSKTIHTFLETLSQAWPSRLAPPLVSSFDLNLLLLLKAQNPTLPLGYVVENFSFSALDQVKHHGLSSLHCHYPSITAQDWEILDQQPIPLLLYTVNDRSVAKNLLAHPAVSAIFSDFPNLIS